SAETTSGSGTATAYSEVFMIFVYNATTQSQVTASFDTLSQLSAQYAAYKTASGAAAAKTMAVAWLQTQSTVVGAGLTADGEGVWFISSAGIPEILLDTPPGSR